jgi:hypothetical protein
LIGFDAAGGLGIALIYPAPGDIKIAVCPTKPLQYRQRNFAQIYQESRGAFKTGWEERPKNQRGLTCHIKTRFCDDYVSEKVSEKLGKNRGKIVHCESSGFISARDIPTCTSRARAVFTRASLSRTLQ